MACVLIVAPGQPCDRPPRGCHSGGMPTPSAHRPGLSRERIIAAALELVDEAGAEQLSMRQLGRRLGVDPMAIYHHLPNKAAVLDGIVEALWGGLELPAAEPGESWRAVLSQIFTALRERLLSHPRAVVVVGSRPLVTPASLRLVDEALARLAAAGLPGAGAMPLLDCLSAFTVGKTLAEVAAPLGRPGSSAASAVTTISPQSHPHIAATLAGGYAYAPTEQFRSGLAALIDGWQFES